MGIVNEIKSLWPLAYAEYHVGELRGVVPIKKHLEATACLMNCVLKERLNVVIALRGPLGKLLKGIDVEDLFYTIGLLHDLGKASAYYLEGFINKLTIHSDKVHKLSFPSHEYVISVILENLVKKEREEKLKAVLDLLAKTISRHHTAMINRHPARINRYGMNVQVIERALAGVCYEGFITFIGRELIPLCKQNNYNICNYVLENLLANIKNVKPCSTKLEIYHFNALQSFEVAGLGRSIGMDESYKFVVIASGALIIADNIAAEYEGRHSDEGGSRLYTEHWKRELSDNLRYCLKLCLLI